MIIPRRCLGQPGDNAIARLSPAAA